MSYPPSSTERSPKGDHNRRLSLGVDVDRLAAEAGITPGELRAYEFTPVGEDFDVEIARRVGEALERLERVKSPLVENGPPPEM